MNDNNSLPTLSFSYDKNNITIKKNITNKLIRDIKKIKNQSLIKEKKKLFLNKFHHDSLLNSFNNRYIQTHKKQQSYNLITTCNNFSPSIDLYNTLNKDFSSNRTLSFGSISTTIQNYSHKKNYSKPIFRNYNSRNKIEFLGKFNLTSPKKTRAESIDDLKYKTKEIFFEKYFTGIQKNEYKIIIDERDTIINLMNIKIYNYQKMIDLIHSHIKTTDEYLKHLYLQIKIESNKNLDLSEKKKEILYETYLLNFRFGRVQKIFERCIDNKFFLLCVKNGTNDIDKFSEEDKLDYQQDCNSLNLISNFNAVQKKMGKKKTISIKGKVKRYSLLEENMSSGIRIIREPKPIFLNPEDFKKKLDIISLKIQKSIVEYNEKNNELLNLREIFNEKKEEISKEEQLKNFFEEEISVAKAKLSEVKLRNDYLTNYLKIIPKNTKINTITLIDKKVKEIHKEISEKEKFKKTETFKIDENDTTLSRLLDIENIINTLIQFEKEQEKNNNENLNLLKKMIEINNRIKINKLAKIKRLNEIKEKEEKIIEKSNKIIFKPIKKVVQKINFKKKIKK